MLTIILCMAMGIAIGALLRRHPFSHISTMTIVLIWLLLFMLGYEIGHNDHIMSTLGTIGLDALIVGSLATLGSAAAAWLLGKLIERRCRK